MPSENRYDYTRKFNSALHALNEEQKKAVFHLEGPELVIAGPGTGKTQILATRIGLILSKTDQQAHNILCLTFTDSATNAMRNRLVELIGPTAHRIHIFTFHGFCNQVIQENPGTFGSYRQLELLSDLERVDVFQEILDQLPNDHILKKLKGDAGYESRRLKNLFDLMKKENLHPTDFKSRITAYLERRKSNTSDSELFYQRKYKSYSKGDLKEKNWNALIRKMEELEAGISEFTTYENINQRLNRYDYQDMILWVLKAFEKDEHLLAQYQERYQYILVDEFQDTNGSQSKVLELLTNYWDQPNLFVVGDDDQAIYKFQGANLANITNFRKKYNPFTVVLKYNYRSTQGIIDAAGNLISQNEKERFSKEIIAAGANSKIFSSPSIYSFENSTQEQAYLLKLFESYLDSGRDLSKIAVIYRNHQQVEKLVEVLEKKGIPLNIRKKLNILNISLVRNVLKIMEYIQLEYEKTHSGEHLLFEIMHYNFFNIPIRDIGIIAYYCQYKKGKSSKKWRDVVQDPEILAKLNLQSSLSVNSFSHLLENWISGIPNMTLQVLFENILNKGSILSHLFKHSDNTWLLQIISTLFDHIKDESTKNPTLTLTNYLAILEKMKLNNIALPINKVISSDNGINFLTAHAAKGHEFETVFMLGCTKNIWDKSGRKGTSYTYPDDINVDLSDTGDERRLFYVAMTRAKKELVISFAASADNGKILGQSQFIDEIISSSSLHIENQKVSEDNILKFLYLSMAENEKAFSFIDHALVDKVLTGYKMSVTGLNKYMNCSLSFYFENILRVPTARNKYMGFGRAIHRAFQMYYTILEKGDPCNKSTLNSSFGKAMDEHRSHFTDKEYKEFFAYGQMILSDYWDYYLSGESIEKSYQLETKIEHAEYEGIPLKGVLDKVEIKSEYVHVVDYKTGKFDSPRTRKKLRPASDKNHDGGDYWRQIVFYKILLDSDKKQQWKMISGELDFVEPHPKTGQFFKQKYLISPADIKLVGEQIKNAWESIHQHKFEGYCDDDLCYWCNFVQNDFVLPSDIIIEQND